MGQKDLARRVAVAVLVASAVLVAGCGGSSYDDSYEDSDTSDSPSSYNDSGTFPESSRDSDYTGNNGSDAEDYCSQINSPDMDACQRGYNNLDRAINGG